MSIAPISLTVTVKAAPARAFEIFTGDIGRWWPKGKTPADQPHVDIIIEPQVQGRWFERDENGNETQWGRVIIWEPPSRVVLGWQLNSQFEFDPSFLTEVELTFAPAGAGQTLITLEHRNLERFGANAETFKGRLSRGWPYFLSAFHDFANAAH
jgi:uncharacterized protein YndB with AHSA1/START domain